MRTHAVPMSASTNGRMASAAAISTTPTHAKRGSSHAASTLRRAVCVRSRSVKARAVRERPACSCAIADALAQQARWPEDEDGDEDEEREHVLIVAAEEREIGIVRAALRDGARPVRQAAQIGEIADIACAEGLDHAEQQPAEHGAGKVTDAAQH